MESKNSISFTIFDMLLFSVSDLLNADNMGDPRFAHGNTVKCLFDVYNKYAHTYMHTYFAANTIREQGVDPNADLLKGRKNIGENKKSPAPINIIM